MKNYKYLKHAASTHRLNEQHVRRLSEYDKGVFAGTIIGAGIVGSVWLLSLVF